MCTTLLETSRLTLVGRTREETLGMFEAMSPVDKQEVSADWLRRLHASGEHDPWIHGFSIICRKSGERIGQCGFVAPPGVDGVVEIAYGIDPAHEGKGFATEAAQALVGYALACKDVRTVRAHTLPHATASARVLEKCGFRLVGEFVDPHDGKVRRFERSTAEA
jgi:RimJ/RimL family protein N-acetyltransferase